MHKNGGPWPRFEGTLCRGQNTVYDSKGGLALIHAGLFVECGRHMDMGPPAQA